MVKIEGTVTDRTYGVEIEFYAKLDRFHVSILLNRAGVDCRDERYNHETTRYWKIVTDGSLRRHCPAGYFGMELVSPILKGANGLAQIRKVCEVINRHEVGLKITKACGLHVHHGAEGFRTRQFNNLLRMYKYYEDELDSLVAPSRRKNRNHQYCATVQNTDVDYLMIERYCKLNLCSFERHGTIEFRHFNGTADADKICGWVNLTQAMTERAVKVSCVRKSNNPRYNLFWVISLYKTGAKEMARGTNREEQLINLFAQIRRWVKDRKAQLATA